MLVSCDEQIFKLSNPTNIKDQYGPEPYIFWPHHAHTNNIVKSQETPSMYKHYGEWSLHENVDLKNNLVHRFKRNHPPTITSRQYVLRPFIYKKEL